MRENRKIVILFTIIWAALSGCIDTFDARIPNSVSDLLVVNGNIISDSTVVISLSKTFSINREEPPLAFNTIDAEVHVVGSDGTSIEGTAIGEGQYKIQIGQLNQTTQYSLEIIYEGNKYTSIPQYPIKSTAIDNLTYEQPEDYGDIYICASTQNIETTEPLYYMWTYVEDWEVRTTYYSKWVYVFDEDTIYTFDKAPYAQGWTHHVSDKTLLGSTESNIINQLKNKRIYSIKSDDIRVSYYYSTLLTQRNLSKGEFEYYQCRMKQNEEMGGLFTPQPSELPTNITCDNPEKQVIGYVGVNMNVSQRRLYISTDDIQYLNPLKCWVVKGARPYRLLAEQGLRIAYFTDGPNGGYYWAPTACCDCRALGGTPNKPSFWPLPDREY